MPDFVLHVGSRGGGYAALLFFSVIFATLGGVVAREYRKQRLGGRGPAVLAGLAVFVGLLMLVYYSSLNGFYEAELSPTHLELRYLPPFSRERVAWSEISRAEARPAYRGSWRVHLVLASGGELKSATSDRASIESATRRLQAQISIVARQPEWVRSLIQGRQAEGLRGASEGWARGVARERASTPPASALVTKSPGVFARRLAGGEFPVDGRCYKELPFLPYPL